MVKVSIAVLACAASGTFVNAYQPQFDFPWMQNLQADPAERAAALVKEMNLTEKVHMLHGSGEGYVGNVEANTRLNIPAIKMNDGPQGFRGIPGTSTAFPSGLNAAATWDGDLVELWGKTMGEEFFDKGANVQLGPGMCVARVPHNGRNFEYLSGEDPFLGYKLVPRAIKGIQDQGVIANAKHYVNNNQETDRTTVSENVDERTQFEFYYPPFRGAVEAGVGSVMCSYNKIRETWSCENPETLQRDLKDRMGFKGWVMSDWGATHSTSINAGLDQEMPSDNFMGDDALTKAVAAGNVTEDKINDSVMRILTPMFQFGVFDTPNNGTLDNNVTSAAHNLAARQISSASTVLLKNDGVLPLPSSTNSIAIIGAEASNPTTHGGGSGQVTPGYVATPLFSLKNKLGSPPAPARKSNCSDGQFDTGFDYRNTDSQTSQSDVDSVEDCCSLCAARPDGNCNYFTYVAKDKTCWMKSTNNNRVADADAVSGGCHAEPPEPQDPCHDGVCVYVAGDDTGDAAKAAEQADVSVVFVATTSSEGSDRDSLSLGHGDDLVNAVIAATASNSSKKVIVVAVTPGALLTPWADKAAAVLIPFMPGQEYGNAITDVLFGEVNPSAKLPLTFPNVDNEQQFTPEQWPGVGNPRQANYSEGGFFGYRWYDKHDVTPAFPFGHGLSYTTFDYSNLKIETGNKHNAKVTATVTNNGTVAGAEVAQLYLKFPEDAEEPIWQLKGFDKTASLAPGASATVEFDLVARDVSTWNVDGANWTVAPGTFEVAVGASSRDQRLTGSIKQ